MTSKSKIKGNTFEREVVNEALSYNLKAKRAYASNGQSLGLPEDVDVVIEGYSIQCKRRKKLGSVIKPNREGLVQVVREDRGDTYVIMPLSMWLYQLAFIKNSLGLGNGTK